MDPSLVLNIAVPVVAAAVVNALVFALKWNGSQPKKNRLLPPGAAVGAIWIVLLGLLGYARHRVGGASVAGWALVALVVFCLAYSFITRGMRKNIKVTNTATLILAGVVGATVLVADPVAAAFVAPTVVWAAYVNIVDAIECDGP